MPTGAFRSAVNDHHQKKNTNKMGVPAPAGGELEKNLPYTWAHDGTWVISQLKDPELLELQSK